MTTGPVTTTVDTEVRQRLCGLPTITISDGFREWPAHICGWRNQFATVRATDHRGPCGEWSWEAVVRVVVNHEGKFQT